MFDGVSNTPVRLILSIEQKIILNFGFIIDTSNAQWFSSVDPNLKQHNAIKQRIGKGESERS